MENHPIPQDVSGFQFRLIGDITIKQFAYLAAGAILAWLSFVLPISLFIKIPFAILFASLGLSLAFLPIEGRPFDVMLGNFLRALFSPNQFVYQKMGGQLSSVSYAIEKTKKHGHVPSQAQPSTAKLLDSYLRNATGPKTELDKKEEQFFASVLPTPTQPQQGFHIPIPFLQTHQATQPTPQPKKEQSAVEETQPPQPQTAPVVQEPVASPAPTEKPAPQTPPPPPAPAPTIEQPPVQQPQPVVAPTNPSPIPQPQQAAPVAKGIPPIAPHDPNVIVGIVRDPRGNILPNILVEIKDQDGNPVRAFKTNQLGQFASATPLLNGTYLLIFEDPKGTHKFQDFQLEVNGQLIPPLEIASTDAREDLRKELFGA